MDDTPVEYLERRFPDVSVTLRLRVPVQLQVLQVRQLSIKNEIA